MLTSRLPMPSCLVSILTFFMLLLCGQPAMAQHPNHPLGSSPDRLYQAGLDQIDQVDLMTGTLSVGIPIGPFDLVYNSNVWRYKQRLVDGQVLTKARPDSKTTAGLGWHLGLGEVYSPEHLYNDTGQWLYVSPDGGRHIFFQNMHMYVADSDHTMLYTRNGQYLRLRYTNNEWVEIEFPDGTTQRFDSETGGLGTTYRLTHVWDAFGSLASPDMTVTYVEDDHTETRTITDRYGRVHVIYLSLDEPWIDRVVTQVDIESFGGQRALYDFTYDTVDVDVSCKHNDPAAASRISIPHLSRIDLPDGSAYSMKDGGDLLYTNLCNSNNEDATGILKRLILPTGGQLSWTFQEYDFPPGEANSPFNSSAGVASRHMHAYDGTVVGTWTYRTTQDGFVDGIDPEVRTEVVYPTGDCTKYYFNARYTQNPEQGRGWEYGLPFSKSASSGGKDLSYENYDGSTGTACSGTKLRSYYVSYRHDVLPGTTNYPVFWWHHSNRHVQGNRVVFHQDGDRYIDNVFSDFDGLGNFRQTTTTSNFWDGSANFEERTRLINYNVVDGNYPGSFTTPAEDDAWILNLYDSVEMTETDALGIQHQKVEYNYDPDTGALLCTRHLKDASTRSPTDIVTVYGRDTLGQVTSAKRWGSDLTQVSVNGEGCGDLSGNPEHEMGYEYTVGILTKATAYNSQGLAAAFASTDIDVDPSTGLTTVSRDAAGLATVYQYDELGRLTQMTPPGTSRAVYSYDLADNVSGPKVTVERKPVGAETVLGRRTIGSDHFGRRQVETKLLPSGGTATRTTTLSARGWTESVSEWGFAAKLTAFSGYDPFGRATRVTPPEGSAYDLKFTHKGIRKVTFEAKVGQADGESYVNQVQEFDSQGRVRKIIEPSGVDGASVTTTYSYDINSNLTKMETVVPPPPGQTEGITQTREFSYDSHGFLLSKTLPELGTQGGGTVTFSNFDTLGNARSKNDGRNNLAYVYDGQGRVVEVRDQNHLDEDNKPRLVTELVYDSAAGQGKRRFASTTQHNWFDFPWDSVSTEKDLQVEESYAYEGEGGTLSKITVTYRWDNREFAFEQDFVYNSSGELLSQTYPYCAQAECNGSNAATGMTLGLTYQRGHVKTVSGWINGVTYNTAGRWTEILHANGAKDRFTPDANNPNRPSRLWSVDSDDNSVYDSGTITYDGASNITAMGDDSYSYDEVGRLAEASTTLPWDDSLTWSETFEYDAFGNPTQKTMQAPGLAQQTVSFATDSEGNRLAAATYDAAGNLTGWAGKTYRYDSNNRLTRAAWMNYAYNARGERVAAFAEFSTESMSFLLRDDTNKLVSGLTWSDAQGMRRNEDYVWLGNRLVGRSINNGALKEHYHLDHVGSIRGVTDTSGLWSGVMDFTPFGQEIPNVTNDDLFHFAGHERVASSGLDAMHRRFYSSELMRFLSKDPVSGNLTKPQTMNRYAYGINNPLLWVDPDGRDEREWVRQGEVRRVPSDWTLEVMREIGTLGPASRDLDNVAAIVALGPFMGMMGVSARAITITALLGSAGEVGKVNGQHGFDPNLMLSGALKGASDALIVGALFGQWSSTIVDDSTRANAEFLLAAVSAYFAGFKSGTEDKFKTKDGGSVEVLKDGTVVVKDKDGNILGIFENTNATAQDPAKEKADGGKKKGGKWKFNNSPKLTHEDALEKIRDLQGGRCVIDPVTCRGGGNGFAGYGNRHQFY